MSMPISAAFICGGSISNSVVKTTYHCLCQRAVRIPKSNGARLAIANPADLRKPDPAVGVVNVRGLELRNPESVPNILGLELQPLLASGISLGTKAVLDRTVEVSEHLLKSLRHGFFEESGFIGLLSKDELGSHFVVDQQLLAGLLAFVL